MREPGARRAPDLVERDYGVNAPDLLWVADITHIPTQTRPLYLAAVLDAFSRRVVGWAMALHLRAALVFSALEMALNTRRPERVIHHSDQGSQYTSSAFRKLCEQAGVACSVGSVGDCYDNAMAESFFATLECELQSRISFPGPQTARDEVFRFIEGGTTRGGDIRPWATGPRWTSNAPSMRVSFPPETGRWRHAPYNEGLSR